MFNRTIKYFDQADLETYSNLLGSLPAGEQADALATLPLTQLAQVYEHVTGEEADDNPIHLIEEITDHT